MRSRVFLGALSAAALVLPGVSAAEEPLDTVRALSSGSFGTRSFDSFLYWLVEGASGAQAEYVSAPCFEKQSKLVTIDFTDEPHGTKSGAIMVVPTTDDVIDASSGMMPPSTPFTALTLSSLR